MHADGVAAEEPRQKGVWVSFKMQRICLKHVQQYGALSLRKIDNETEKGDTET